jgi:hypothetical protein
MSAQTVPAVQALPGPAERLAPGKQASVSASSPPQLHRPRPASDGNPITRLGGMQVPGVPASSKAQTLSSAVPNLGPQSTGAQPPPEHTEYQLGQSEVLSQGHSQSFTPAAASGRHASGQPQSELPWQPANSLPWRLGFDEHPVSPEEPPEEEPLEFEAPLVAPVDPPEVFCPVAPPTPLVVASEPVEPSPDVSRQHPASSAAAAPPIRVANRIEEQREAIAATMPVRAMLGKASAPDPRSGRQARPTRCRPADGTIATQSHSTQRPGRSGRSPP